MPTVITAKDIEKLVSEGGDPAALPADALLTPSAKDALRDLKTRRGAGARLPVSQSANVFARPVSANSSPAELEAFFNS
ncbi:MAG TPA: hypothetical protein PKC18_02375, partial [Lacipirellulaceae bacterium]|nr:hypothetical protein [Lacipirellulaceae bacterium]